MKTAMKSPAQNGAAAILGQWEVNGGIILSWKCNINSTMILKPKCRFGFMMKMITITPIERNGLM
jgi:hypothetical protein